jgi:signal transduction histidine kinase
MIRAVPTPHRPAGPRPPGAAERSRADAELARDSQRARLLLQASRALAETLELQRLYDRFRELLAEAIQHDGVVVSSYDESDGLIRCDYAWVEGRRLDPAIFPPLQLNQGGGMQSAVIRTGEPLLANDVQERVKGEGTYYDVDREGTVRKLPESGPSETRAAMMMPVKHEGRVVGVVQVMSDHSLYSEQQLELAEGLVAQLSAAVRNAQLHEERTRLQAAEAAARAVAEEREYAARLLEAVGDGIFLVDPAGDVRFWNSAAELVTGLSAASVRSRPVTEVFGSWPRIAGEIPVAEDRTPARAATLPVDVNERELWLSFVAVQTPIGVVYAFRDLTLEHRLDEVKSDFIATVSHELRTPMTAVLGAAKTLLREDLRLTEDERVQLLEMIAAQATRLSQVTEDVLLATNLDRGDLRVSATRVDIDEVASDAVKAMQPQVPSTVSLELQAGSCGSALGDRDRVEQVLVNLIDNAVKYSASGQEVVVSTERLDDAVRVSVADAGEGIPEPEQDRIFEKFYRSDSQLTRVPSGTGLGLYICRELVHRMGGRIGVTSEAGSGSTFFFELPPA